MFDRRQLQQLYSYGFSLCADQDWAYDLVHSALERVFRRRGTGKGEGKGDYSLNYCRTVVRNLYIDECRKRDRVPFHVLDEETAVDFNESTLEDIVLQQTTLERLWPLFDDADREILYLWAIMGMTAAEIAIETESTRGTVLSRIHRLRKKVASYVHKEASVAIQKGGRYE